MISNDESVIRGEREKNDTNSINDYMHTLAQY